MTERFDRGMEKIQALYGEFGQGFFEDLEDIAPDFGRFIAEFSYGDVFARLSPNVLRCVRHTRVLRQRQIGCDQVVDIQLPDRAVPHHAAEIQQFRLGSL